MVESDLDALVVYGDREHFANLQWLTNYDPRFEEALLIVRPQSTPHLLVGNEGMTYANIARLEVERILYQPFSLLGQPRDKVEPLSTLLERAGLKDCRHVGVAGWKYFSEEDRLDGENTLEVPEYIASALRRIVGQGGRVTNATALFMDAENGLRNIHQAEQLADFEWVATHNSQNLLEGIRAVRPGLSEHEIFAQMPYNGLPFRCSPVCASGENLRFLLSSPSSRVLEKGDPIFLTYSYEGANCCRFGWVAENENDLSDEAKNYLQSVAFPYFEAIAAWYRTLQVGCTGDALHRAVRDRLEPLGFYFSLNCGHLTAADEWTHSAVYSGSEGRAQSGNYWQCDFFPTLPSAHFGAFAEDGVAVADENLRGEIAARYPAMWLRIEARRQFMTEQLGLEISDDLLPFSNFCAAVIPFFLVPDRCIVLPLATA